MIRLPKEEHQINRAKQILKSILQDNFPEIKNDFRPQIKIENTWENRPKKSTQLTGTQLVSILDMRERKKFSGYPG